MSISEKIIILIIAFCAIIFNLTAGSFIFLTKWEYFQELQFVMFSSGSIMIFIWVPLVIARKIKLNK